MTSTGIRHPLSFRLGLRYLAQLVRCMSSYTHDPLAYLADLQVPGHAICLIMAFIFASAVESVRRPYFEAFWYTHHLFFLFYALLCVHGAARLLEPPTFWAWMLGPAVAYVVERTVRMLRGKQDTILQLVRGTTCKPHINLLTSTRRSSILPKWLSFR
jgi:hypothetical protein